MMENNHLGTMHFCTEKKIGRFQCTVSSQFLTLNLLYSSTGIILVGNVHLRGAGETQWTVFSLPLPRWAFEGVITCFRKSSLAICLLTKSQAVSIIANSWLSDHHPGVGEGKAHGVCIFTFSLAFHCLSAYFVYNYSTILALSIQEPTLNMAQTSVDNFQAWELI